MTLSVAKRLANLDDDADEPCSCDERGLCKSCRARDMWNQIDEMLKDYERETLT